MGALKAVENEEPKDLLRADRLNLLRKIGEGERLIAEHEAKGGDRKDLDASTVAGWLGEQYDADEHGWLRRSLNRLREWRYILRLKESGYALTDKGRKAITE